MVSSSNMQISPPRPITTLYFDWQFICILGHAHHHVA